MADTLHATIVDGLRRDLAAGWPADVVLLFAQDHAEALALLPDGTPGRDEAIRSVREFITEQGGCA